MTKRPDRLLTDFPRDPIDAYWSPALDDDFGSTREREPQDVGIGRVKVALVVFVVGIVLLVAGVWL